MSTALAEHSMEAVKAIVDFDDFARQPEFVICDVLAKVGWILRHTSAPHRHKGAIAIQAARALGVETGSFLRYKKAFRKHNWRGITDKRSAPSTTRGLHPLTKSWVASLFDSMQRDNDDAMEVHRKVIDRWNLWKLTGDPSHQIPGYSSCPPADPSTGLPTGMSYDTILRLRPKAPARALAKHGPKEGSIFLPPVLTTRVGSAVLSRVLFDDQDLDNLLADGFLAISGITNTQKPVSFNSMDFYTAAHLDQHLRAQYKDPESGRDKTLSGMEYTWFVINHLQTRGFRTDFIGTEIIEERGTAKSWAADSMISFGGHHSFADALHALTGVRVNRSGLFNTPLFADMCFRPSSSGNFKFKTWLESAFRLLRTYMQALPGATGSRERDNGREETYGIRLEEKNLLSAIYQTVDPGTQEFLRANLRHELLDLATFHQLILAVYRAVNARTQHKLEGWHQCGFTTTLWRPSERSETWFSQDELNAIEDPEEKRYLIKRLNSNRDLLTKEDRLSPAMALEIELARDAKHISKLKDEFVGLLLPTAWAVEKKVGSNHCFTLPNPLWPDTQETYVASWDHAGMQVTLDAGKQLLVYHNPFSGGRAQLHDMNGAYITTLFPTVRAEPFRQDRTLVQLAARAKVKSGHEAHLKARLADIAAGRVTNREHNRILLDLTKEDRARTANAKRKAEPYPGSADPAAANRLQAHGKATDWDTYTEPEAPAKSAWDDLPEDSPIPDAFH